MDRKKEQIDHYQYDFEREGFATLGLERTAEAIAPAPAPQPPALSCPITPPKSTWRMWKQCASTCVAAITTKSCFAKLFARLTPEEHVGAIRACAARQPKPVRIPPAVRRGATGGCFAWCGWRGSAWRPARLPAPRDARATLCAMRTIFVSYFNPLRNPS